MPAISSKRQSSQLQPVQLCCEYRENPLGLGVPQPRLSWKLESSARGVVQRTYQILVASSAAGLAGDKGDLWDSGKVATDQSIHIEYQGKPLNSGQQAHWKVRVWDAKGSATGYSQAASWEMGLLKRSDWKGKWVGSALVGGPRTASPAPFLRKGFAINKPIQRARLYVTALGVHECYLNGQRVSGDVFSPGWTDYRKRVQYDVYDVAAHLRPGQNVVGAILGDGWYCGQVEGLHRQFYGDRPRLLAQLVIEFKDGTSLLIASDGSWKTASGPILANDLLVGEAYDARLEMPGWSEPGFDETQWTAAKTFDDPGIAIVARPGPPVRRVVELKPITAPQKNGSVPGWHYSGVVVDMGQNMVGRVRIKVRGERGSTLRLRHGEMLTEQGTLYTANLRGIAATDYYTFKSSDEEIWEPRFTFHGFRYVEISSHKKFELSPDGVTGIVLHSDTPLTGEFECSDPLINQLQHNIQWGQRGNFLDIPTDCPQRDERLGWTGDAQVFIRTAAFNMNVAGFFTKWQTDIDDAQAASGSIPPTVPRTILGEDGGPAWADASIICPWTVYLCYGDTRLLAQHYDTLVRYVEYLQKTSRGLLRCGGDYLGYAGFGDWLALDGSGKTDGGTPKELIGTAFFAYSSRLLSRIAKIIGKPKDAAKYQRQFEKIRKAFIQHYVTSTGLMAAQTQTAYVLALHFDLLPDKLRANAAQALVRDIRQRGNHLSTGFVGSPYLCHVLTQMGHTDVAFDLLRQKTWPSWLYSVTQGATTIWERWDGWTHDKGFQDVGMNSFNHYAYGAIGSWLYQRVAGIELDPDRPAYKHILLHPTPGGELTHAKASLESVHGRISSAWRIEKGRFAWEVEIPPNTTATAYLPAKDGKVLENAKPVSKGAGILAVRHEGDQVILELGSGTYSFSCRA